MQSIRCKRGKASGPDGFPIELYIAFSSKLVPILKFMYDEILSTEKLPETLSQATISALLKKDKDPLVLTAQSVYCAVHIRF